MNQLSLKNIALIFALGPIGAFAADLNLSCSLPAGRKEVGGGIDDEKGEFKIWVESVDLNIETDGDYAANAQVQILTEYISDSVADVNSTQDLVNGELSATGFRIAGVWSDDDTFF